MSESRARKSRRRSRARNKKSIALVLSMALLAGGIVGGTLAWLTAESGSVENTFTESNISIDLDEDKPVDRTAQMVPGWTIDKDPKVTVTADSEDCWLFVKITESTAPDLDAYISYAIADGWDIVEPIDQATGKPVTTIENTDEIVIGRKVYKNQGVDGFDILGAGSYKDSMGTPKNEADDYTITWDNNEVGVKPSVTEQMMEAIAGTNAKPTLSFQAYAVQLFKTNSDGNNSNTEDEFTAAEAWERAAAMNNGSGTGTGN